MGRLGMRADGGFTLVEILVALTVLSISVVGVASMVALAQEGITAGGKGLDALALADSRLERLRALPFPLLLTADLNGDGVVDAVLRDDGTHRDRAAEDGEYTMRQIVGGITMTWAVRPDGPELARSAVALITVTAEWSDRRGQVRTIRLGTLRANPVYAGAVP